MYNKKGIEVTFSWVFAIIAGAVIFLFFVGFAAENMDFFGKLTAIRVSEEMNSAFTGLKTGLVSTSLSFNKEIKLQFKCIDGEREKLIVGYRSGKNLYDNLVFSPEELNGNEFLLMTKAWNVPYKVDNFIFISDKNKRYCLRDAPNKLKNNLPSEFESLLKYDESDCIGKNIIFQSSICAQTNDKNKIIVQYSSDSFGNFYGIICGSNWEYPFYGDAMIYAAIFGEQFDCLYSLIEEKFNIMRDVYLKKIVGISCSNKGGLYNAISSMDAINKIQNSFDNIDNLNKGLIGEGCDVF